MVPFLVRHFTVRLEQKEPAKTLHCEPTGSYINGHLGSEIGSYFLKNKYNVAKSTKQYIQLIPYKN